jgi:precorrin-4 methylase
VETQKPIYKIQIGVFRNTPDANVLSRIPEVSSKPVAGKNITRYYSGNWDKYSAAAQNIQRVRNNGFPGAFVVAFLNGRQISVVEAKKISGE